MNVNTKKKHRHKPLYKKFNHIFENVQFKTKIFKFKRKKWIKLQNFTRKQFFLKNNYLLEKKTSDPHIKFTHRPLFKKNFSFLSKAAKKLKLYYGGKFKKKYFYNLVKKIQKIKIKRFGTSKHYIEKDTLLFIEHMERRLESVIRKAFFFDSITKIRQMVNHGHVFVNNQTIRNEEFLVKDFDLIEVSLKFKKQLKQNMKKLSYIAPIPTNQTNLLINYKTFQVYYIGRKTHLGTSYRFAYFPIQININKLINFFKYK